MSEQCAARVAARFERRGHNVTLRRVTGSESQTETDATVKAVVRGREPDEIIGNLSQFDSVVLVPHNPLAAASWPLPPKRNDRVVDSGRTMVVLAAAPMHDGEEIAFYKLAVTG